MEARRWCRCQRRHPPPPSAAPLRKPWGSVRPSACARWTCLAPSCPIGGGATNLPINASRCKSSDKFSFFLVGELWWTLQLWERAIILCLHEHFSVQQCWCPLHTWFTDVYMYLPLLHFPPLSIIILQSPSTDTDIYTSYAQLVILLPSPEDLVVVNPEFDTGFVLSLAARLMGKSWWSVPSMIDVTNTTYVQIPILHGEVPNWTVGCQSFCLVVASASNRKPLGFYLILISASYNMPCVDDMFMIFAQFWTCLNSSS